MNKEKTFYIIKKAFSWWIGMSAFYFGNLYFSGRFNLKNLVIYTIVILVTGFLFGLAMYHFEQKRRKK